MINTYCQKFFVVFLLCSVFTLCFQNNFAVAQSIGKAGMVHLDFEKISAAGWSALSSKKIFFGHHSVGDNIIGGIAEIDKKHSNINLKIKRTTDPAFISGDGIFAHGGVGQNFDPLSKIKEFKSLMDNGMGNKLDIAFMKFCFVDIGTQADLVALFDAYKNIMAQLKHEYPHVTFVHVTVPLVVEPQGIKSLVRQKVKSLIGKNDLYENTAKYKYNRLLRNEYSGKEPIFDLAYFESTYPDGKRLTYPVNGIDYEALIPEYSSDGGHLNDQGKNILAEALLLFLSKL